MAVLNILVVNAGSSSLKLRLLGDGDAVRWTGDRPASGDGPGSLGPVFDELAGYGGVAAVGHRFVHGGARFHGPVLVDGRVEEDLLALTDLAPLHQPAALAGLAAARAAAPEVPQVACFDTAFHATMPPAASTYALPREWREGLGIRRYGFHGLSHAYASRRAVAMLAGSAPPGSALAGSVPPRSGTGPGAGTRVVTCHLGSGASLAAVADGRSVDTTMGFTPLEGLVMGTRSGTVDPGALVWLAREAGLSADEIADGLERRSGLLGLAGSADMREVLARAAAGEAIASEAVDVYLHRLRGLIASMAAALGGLDALVFTGGVGEGSAAVRAGAAAGLGFLGVALDERRNTAHGGAAHGGAAHGGGGDGGAAHGGGGDGGAAYRGAAHRDASFGGDADITAEGASARTFVVAAREDIEIARGVRAVCSPP